MSLKLDYLPADESFLDPIRADAGYPAAARAVAIPFGLEASVSYGGGTAAGPAAILAASHQLELYDDELGCEPYRSYGVAAIREKSLRLTRRLMDAAAQRGWRLNTPNDDRQRGGSVVIDVPGAATVTQRLLAADVIVDHRPNAGIRMAPHFYNSEADIDRAVEVMAETVSSRKLEARS